MEVGCFLLHDRACQRYADKLFLGSRDKADEPFQWITFKEFDHMVNQARVILKNAGIGPGDVVSRKGIICMYLVKGKRFLSYRRLGSFHQVGVISSNRPEWAVAAYAIYSLGGILVPMYEQQRLKEMEYIIADSKIKLLLVSKERIYDEVRSKGDHLRPLHMMVVLPPLLLLLPLELPSTPDFLIPFLRPSLC